MKIIKTLSEHKNLLLFFAGFWTIFIAFLCLANFNSLPKIGIGIKYADKYVHVALYFFFTIFWSGYLKAKNPNNNISFLKVVVAAIVYGIAIEIAQGIFTTTRKADIMDVLANTSGSVFAVVMILIGAKFSSEKR